jgi:hypothetical protein
MCDSWLYITSHYVKKHSIFSEVKNWQVCYLGMVRLVVVHYIVDLPKFCHQMNGGDQSTINQTT